MGTLLTKKYKTGKNKPKLPKVTKVAKMGSKNAGSDDEGRLAYWPKVACSIYIALFTLYTGYVK